MKVAYAAKGEMTKANVNLRDQRDVITKAGWEAHKVDYNFEKANRKINMISMREFVYKVLLNLIALVLGLMIIIMIIMKFI